MLVAPSPKFQFQLLMGWPPSSTPAEVKFTDSGNAPLVGLALNARVSGDTLIAGPEPGTVKEWSARAKEEGSRRVPVA